MTNGFIDTGVDYDEVSRLAIVRAEDLNSGMAAVVAFADKLPSEARLKESRASYLGSTTGTANAQTAAAVYTLTATDGAKIRVKWGYTNTGALTLALVPFGTLAVTDIGGAALTGGEAIANSFGELTYHSGSNHWRITNPNITVANVTTFDISALNAFTTPDDADFLAMHDTSAGQLQKILTTKALVTGWTAGTDVDALADYTLIYDASAGVLRKVLTGLIADEYSIILKGQFFARA